MLTKEELSVFNEKIATNVATMMDKLGAHPDNYFVIKELLFDVFTQNYNTGFKHGRLEIESNVEKLAQKHLNRLENILKNTEGANYDKFKSY